jgi:creatinine amidohydrolase
MKLLEMNTIDFQEYVRSNDAVIIPSGAFEIWGPHLPVGADTIIAEEIADRLADRMGWLVGPTVSVGDSLLSWGPGAVTVSPDNFRNYLEDVCLSLVKHGIRKFCFINPHVGNVPLIGQVACALKAEHGTESCVFDWWRFIQPLCADILDGEGIMAHGHASEAGTSLFLYLRPELVKTDRLLRTEPKKVNAFPDVQVFWSISDVSDTAMIGDATKATREKGERIVEKALERMTEFLRQW